MRSRAPRPLRPVPEMAPVLNGQVPGRPRNCLCPERWRGHPGREDHQAGEPRVTAPWLLPAPLGTD